MNLRVFYLECLDLPVNLINVADREEFINSPSHLCVLSFNEEPFNYEIFTAQWSLAHFGKKLSKLLCD